MLFCDNEINMKRLASLLLLICAIGIVVRLIPESVIALSENSLSQVDVASNEPTSQSSIHRVSQPAQTDFPESHPVPVHLNQGSIQVTLLTGFGALTSSTSVSVAIESMPVSPQSVRRFGETNDSGVVSFKTVEPGKYLVSTGHIGPDKSMQDSENSGIAPAFKIVTVARENVLISLKRVEVARLRVRVRYSITGKQEPAAVFLRSPEVGYVQDWQRQFRASANEYSDFFVPPGKIDIIANNSVYGWGEVSVNLRPGETMDIDIWLSTDYPSLSFTVLGPMAADISSFSIHDKDGGLVYFCGPQSAKLWFSSQMTSVQERPNGTAQPDATPVEEFKYEISALAPGEYSVIFFVDNEAVASKGFELDADTELKLYTAQ